MKKMATLIQKRNTCAVNLCTFNQPSLLQHPCFFLTKKHRTKTAALSRKEKNSFSAILRHWMKSWSWDSQKRFGRCFFLVSFFCWVVWIHFPASVGFVWKIPRSLKMQHLPPKGPGIPDRVKDLMLLQCMLLLYINSTLLLDGIQKVPF